MKLISYRGADKKERLGIIVEDQVADLEANAKSLGMTLPSTMLDFLKGGDWFLEQARGVERALIDGATSQWVPWTALEHLAPVPLPPSCRDAYAFRQHVATARRNRGVDMIPEFDQFPVFYFTNHRSIIGPGELVVEEDHLRRLDFELECAIVIGRKGKNISSKDGDQYIAGLTIMNDFSARQLQMEEMKLNLGPAKGKDFATAIGPYLVTLDELEDRRIKSDFGSRWDLKMTARHNGELISEGNLKDMDWTFAEIIERASYGVELVPGDVIGSGTVGTGCYLELNGTRALEAKKNGVEYTPVWLKEGDVIELEIERLGSLRHTISRAPESHSILALKKEPAAVS